MFYPCSRSLLFLKLGVTYGVCVYTCQCSHVEVKGQPVGVSSPFHHVGHGSRGINLVIHHACQPSQPRLRFQHSALLLASEVSK